MSDRISIPVDGWKLEARKLGDGIEIAIVTDDKPPTSHYLRLSAIESAALLHYLPTALPSHRPQAAQESRLHRFEDAGFDTCRWCGELKAHEDRNTQPHSNEIARLMAALIRIDAINDNPACFNSEINAVCDTILRPHLAPALRPQSETGK